MNGPRNNFERTLMLNTTLWYQVLPDFLRELYITSSNALESALFALEGHSQLTEHVHTLHILVEAPPALGHFHPSMDRLAQYLFTETIPTDKRVLVQRLILRCTSSIQSLAIVGDLFSNKVLTPILQSTFPKLTELAVPVHFLASPSSPSALRTLYNPASEEQDHTWPAVHSLWIWVTEPATDEEVDRAMMDMRHLKSLRRLAITFRQLDSYSILAYLQYLKVLPSVDCIAVDIATLPRMFPLAYVIYDAYFFDPRVVFVQSGPLSPSFQRSISICAGDDEPFIYDLLMVAPHGVRPTWGTILDKVQERRTFGIRKGYVFPSGIPQVVQRGIGPFRGVGGTDESSDIPPPLESGAS
ncbi:hypothetical protein V5O48_008874 [Marasmius crinis-equi]|uniref:Uncharacterized protein n=1 Tax=Marasmius crinis-equi TaxID=585013 RepID=A0ABR3FD60_9AGAR